MVICRFVEAGEDGPQYRVFQFEEVSLSRDMMSTGFGLGSRHTQDQSSRCAYEQAFSCLATSKHAWV